VSTDYRLPITDYRAGVLAGPAPACALRSYLSDALEALLAGRQPDPAETSPYGCALVRFASLETVTPGEEAR
jgi:hypothetical protein